MFVWEKLCKFARLYIFQGNIKRTIGMKQYKFRLLGMMVSMLLPSIAWAQDCQPSGKYTDANGETNTIAAGDTYVGSAPLTIEFSAIHQQQGTRQHTTNGTSSIKITHARFSYPL